MQSLFQSLLPSYYSLDPVISDLLENNSSEIRASCGRVAKIGDLYDARSDKFLEGYNIFNDNVEGFIRSQSAEKYNSEFLYSSVVSEKLCKLDIHGELTISMLSGLLKSSGSARFVHDKVKNEETVEYSYIVNVRTVKESINMNDKGLRNLVEIDSNNSGTHVVVGITYGATAVATINFDNYKKHDKHGISVQMKSLIAKFHTGGIEGGSGVAYDNIDDEIVNKLGYKIHADLLPHGQKPLTGIQDAIGRMNSLEEEMLAPKFKGKIMEYHLMPLSCVKQIFKIFNVKIPPYRPIDSATIKVIEQLFDEIHEASAKLQSLVNLKNEDVVSDDEKMDIEKFANNFEIAESKMQEDLSALLKKVRSKESTTKDTVDFVKLFKNSSDASPVEVYKFIKLYQTLRDKISFVKKRLSDNISIATEYVQVVDIKISDGYKYMLFFSYLKDRTNPDFFANFKLFDKYRENKKGSKFAFIDTDILAEIAKNEKLENFCVASFRTKYICKNCLREQLLREKRLKSLKCLFLNFLRKNVTSDSQGSI